GVWDGGRGESWHRRGPRGGVEGGGYGRDGARLASTCQDGAVRVWDVAAEREDLCLPKQGNWLYSVQFSPDGTRLAAGVDQAVKVWDAQGRDVLTLRGHVGDVWSVAFSPDGTRLASAGVDQT